MAGAAYDADHLHQPLAATEAVAANDPIALAQIFARQAPITTTDEVGVVALQSRSVGFLKALVPFPESRVSALRVETIWLHLFGVLYTSVQLKIVILSDILAT
jgi:hypothetical protein